MAKLMATETTEIVEGVILVSTVLVQADDSASTSLHCMCGPLKLLPFQEYL